MQPEGNLSFSPVWYVCLLRQLSFLLVTVLLSRSSHFMVSAYIWLWFRYRLNTYFLSCFDLRRWKYSGYGSLPFKVVILGKQCMACCSNSAFMSSYLWCSLSFFYCLIAWQLFKIFRIVTAPFIAIRETALLPQDGPSCFCLMETRVQVQTFRNQDMAGAGFEPAIFRSWAWRVNQLLYPASSPSLSFTIPT